MKILLTWAYGLQCFIIVPWFLGAFYRQEMSPSVDQEFQRQLRNGGTGDALLTLYCYAIFYALPMVLTYHYLPRYVYQRSRRYIAFWVGLTFLLLLPGIIQFIKTTVKTPGFELLSWGALTAYVAFGIIPTIKRDRRLSALSDTKSDEP